MKKILAIFICIFMMLPLTVSASEITLSAIFNADTEKIDISGVAPNGDVILTFADMDSTVEFSNENPPYDILSVYSNNTYNTSVKLGDMAGGKHIVVVAVDNEGNVASDAFFNPDFNNSASVINSLNNAQSLREFQTVADSKALILGFDTDKKIYKTSKSNIYAIMYAIKPSNATAKQFYNLYYNACALAEFKGSSETEVENLLKEYAIYLNIDFELDYMSDGRLTSSSKSTLCNILSSVDFANVLSNEEVFSDYLEKAKALSVIKTSENWQQIKNVMEFDFSNLFTLYSLSDSKSQKVYSAMMTMSYNSFDDIMSNYLLSVKSAENETSRPTGSSSGGGFGGSSSVTLPTEVEIKLPDDDENDNVQQKGDMVIPLANASSSFSDLPSTHWSYKAVSSLTQAKVINGYGDNTFLPDNNITRAEFTKLCCVAFGIPGLNADFTDVSDDAWYNNYIGGAFKYGIINGMGDTFCPDNFITRQDAAVIVYRALKNEGIILNGGADFEDSNDISLYAITAVGAFKENGILSGDGTNFYPLNNITRAEAAKLLFGALSINK